MARSWAETGRRLTHKKDAIHTALGRGVSVGSKLHIGPDTHTLTDMSRSQTTGLACALEASAAQSGAADAQMDEKQAAREACFVLQNLQDDLDWAHCLPRFKVSARKWGQQLVQVEKDVDAKSDLTEVTLKLWELMIEFEGIIKRKSLRDEWAAVQPGWATTDHKSAAATFKAARILRAHTLNLHHGPMYALHGSPLPPEEIEEEEEEEEEVAAADEEMDEADGAKCTACAVGTWREGNWLLLCDGDGCGAAYHTACLRPPLRAVPDDEWLCPSCAPPPGRPLSAAQQKKRPAPPAKGGAGAAKQAASARRAPAVPHDEASDEEASEEAERGEGHGQCERDPRCTRGSKHGGRGGHCKIPKEVVAAVADRERIAADPLAEEEEEEEEEEDHNADSGDAEREEEEGEESGGEQGSAEEEEEEEEDEEEDAGEEEEEDSESGDDESAGEHGDEEIGDSSANEPSAPKSRQCGTPGCKLRAYHSGLCEREDATRGRAAVTAAGL